MAQTQETVVLHGHIIDSLILAKVLDTILMMGGTFDLTDVKIGATREEPSHARIVVRAASGRLLAEILEAIQPHGASVERESDCPLEPAPADGLFPENFYATTHLPTQVRLQGRERVEDAEIPDGHAIELGDVGHVHADALPHLGAEQA